MKRVLVFLTAVLFSSIITETTFSQSNIGIMGVGGKLGFVNPEEVSAVIGFGALVDLGTITPDIVLEGNLDYWSKSKGSGAAETSFRDLILGGTAKYIFKGSNPKLRPFASGGVAFHFFKFDAPGDLLDDSDIKIGIHLGGGLFYALSPQIDLLADGRYSIVSDVSQLAIQGGIVYKLKK
jgi:opacity protein-like surface antigen